MLVAVVPGGEIALAGGSGMSWELAGWFSPVFNRSMASNNPMFTLDTVESEASIPVNWPILQWPK